MRIAVVHSFYTSQVPSGENAVVAAQVESLRNNGLDVELFATATDEVAGQRWNPARSAARVATGHGRSPGRALRDFQPDVVHVHNLFPNWSSSWLRSWPGAVVMTLHNYRTLCAAHTLYRDGHFCTDCPDGQPISSLQHRCYRGSRTATLPLTLRMMQGLDHRHLLNRADVLIALSGRSRDIFQTYGADPRRLVVLPNFLIDDRPHVTGGGNGRFVYAGRVTAEKGLHAILPAWPHDVPLDVFGDGPDADRVAALQHPAVTMHGALAHEDILKRLPDYAGLLLPSLWPEGFPQVYVESLSSGVPVIAVAGSSAADDVASCGTGFVVESPRDAEGVRAAIAAVVQGAASLRETCRASFEARFTEGKWLDSMTDVYKRAVLHRRAAAPD